MNLWHKLFDKPMPADCFGPKDFPAHRGWEGRGVLAKFDELHGIDILIADETDKYNERNYRKTWDTDADEVLFRRGKRIMLYWRKVKCA